MFKACHVRRRATVAAWLSVLVTAAFALAGDPQPTPPPIDLDTVQRATEALARRQAARGTSASRPTPVQSSPPCPTDVDPNTWSALRKYLSREPDYTGRCVAYLNRQLQELGKERAECLKTPHAKPGSMYMVLQDVEQKIKSMQQEIADLKARKLNEYFCGPEIDIEKAKVGDIGYLRYENWHPVYESYRKSEALRLVAVDRKSKRGPNVTQVELEYGRLGEVTQTMDQVFTDHYRLYVNGKATNVTSETHEVSPGGIQVTDTKVVKSVRVLVRGNNPQLRIVACGLSRDYQPGDEVRGTGAYQVTSATPDRVEVREIDLARLTERWNAALRATTRPTGR